jgi:hypothetical protein
VTACLVGGCREGAYDVGTGGGGEHGNKGGGGVGDGVAKDGKGREEGKSWLGYWRAEEVIIYSARVS